MLRIMTAASDGWQHTENCSKFGLIVLHLQRERDFFIGKVVTEKLRNVLVFSFCLSTENSRFVVYERIASKKCHHWITTLG